MSDTWQGTRFGSALHSTCGYKDRTLRHGQAEHRARSAAQSEVSHHSKLSCARPSRFGKEVEGTSFQTFE